MRSRSWRVVVVWLAACVALFSLAGGAVAIPEHCGDITTDEIDSSIEEGVAWLERNQAESGVWLYRYNVKTDEDLGGYNWVRHAGVLLSLEQTARYVAGDVGIRAGQIADRGWPAIEQNYRGLTLNGMRTLAMKSSSSATGGTGLTGIALAERRLRTGDVSLDETLLGLARFVAAQVQNDGSVLNEVNLDSGISRPQSYSPFATGQTLFLLAQARAITGTTEFDTQIAAIIRYLSTERALREGYVPDVSDHWGAYAMAVLTETAPQFLTDQSTVEFIRKQLGIAGIQVRYESQRTNDGLNRWTRGRQTLGAGLGTLGEAIGAWQVVVAGQPALRDQQPWLHERLYCVSELLVNRQVTEREAQQLPNRSASQGSWIQFGITQMDDQQHAISAMVAARNVELDAPNAPRRTPIPENALLVVIAILALLNPGRLMKRGSSCSSIRVSVVGVAVLVALVVLGGPIVRLLNVSAATALVAAGASAVVASLFAFVMQVRSRDNAFESNTEVLLFGILRPEIMLLAIAVGAGGQGWTMSATIAIAVGVAMSVSPLWARKNQTVINWLLFLFMILAIACGIFLIVDGVYAV
jgi:hypothetical protein